MIIWCGGEDVDFQASGASISVGAGYRASYARCSVYPATNTTYIASTPFAGGAVTSAWLSAQVYVGAAPGNVTGMLGLVSPGTSEGIYAGTDSSGTKLSIVTYNGTSFVVLASETGNSMPGGASVKIDMQVSSYGASGTVNLYANGVLVVTYTGNIAVSGATSLQQVANWHRNFGVWQISEVIVSTLDTRTMSLTTLAPAGVGDTDAWTGAYTDVNEVTLNDATSVFTNTAAQDEEFTLTQLPAGLFTVQAVKLIARCSASAGSVATQVALGVRSAGTTVPGTAVSQTTAWVEQESLLVNNPVTSAPWTNPQINALEINLRSA